MAERAGAKKLTALESARGIAAIAVVFYHAAGHLDKMHGVPPQLNIFQFGHAGVDLFFVISGFIILFVHYDDVGRPQRLGHYVGRRLTRIMPTYWVALAATVLLAFLGSHRFPHLFDLVWSASLLPSHTEPVLGIAWTLQYEIVFYAVFCLLILNRMMGIAFLVLWLGWIALAGLWTAAGGGLPSSLFGLYNLEFFLGMAVAYWLKHHSLQMPKLILWIGVAAFAAAAVAEDALFLDGRAALGRLFYGLASVLIVLGAAEAGRRNLIAVPKILRALGAASYSIYIFQFVFIGIAWKLWLASGLDAKTPYLASLPLLALAGVAGGVAASRLIEYPLMDLIRGSRRTKNAAAGQIGLPRRDLAASAADRPEESGPRS